ncbi:alpha/beta fold hydrolase [Sulfitobacter sabulilitoris]|uniref:Alpha/beta hydrolase n=1 Tax=Sulfitobacter sabulilitoris TaxID=2562655 RepID=A0A5S3PLU9_9RHOB|nr:alpha/beta fold hydrolase [Sulfitobacter sabulilitoris]TMM55353.1 alpha/beta hydrolase [Sulfitobacter sabulilitoris]
MADILLIHGSAHGAWCWRDTIPALQALGHSARAIDLPGHGDDPTPVNEVTLDAYADAVVAASTPRTVVLGHSMGGYVITAAAERAPEQMSRLIYLCAYVPMSGKTLSDMRMMAPRQPLLPALRMAPDRRSFTIDPAMTGEVFYQDCPPGTVDYANAHLCAQAVAPNNTPLDVTDRSRSLRRDYIRCLHDQTIPPEFQVTMTEDWPDGTVTEMATGHSPFFADPVGLAARIDQILQT